jgi:hypothetical protein
MTPAAALWDDSTKAMHSGVSLKAGGNYFGSGTEDLINQFDSSPPFLWPLTHAHTWRRSAKRISKRRSIPLCLELNAEFRVEGSAVLQPWPCPFSPWAKVLVATLQGDLV